MLFIPAIDIMNEKCVRLTQGDYTQKREYSQDPVEMARLFQDQGARFIHVVDLDAARDEGEGNISVIQKIVRAVDIPAEVGGGIRSREKVVDLLDMGVERVVLGTLIIKNQSSVRDLVEEFGQKVVAGIDAKEGFMQISGWREGSGICVEEAIRIVKYLGFSLMIYTDVERDGMLQGPNTEQIKRVASISELPIIVGGGISSIEDLRTLRALKEYGVVGVISGKAVYEGRFSVNQACELLGE